MTLTLTSMVPGNHQVSARYSGDSAYGPTTSSTLNIGVNATATALSWSPAVSAPYYYWSSIAGAPTNVTATVTNVLSGQSPSTGSVIFSVDGRPQATVPLALSGSNDQASFTAMLPSGVHTITASYQGDSTHGASTTSSQVTFESTAPTLTVQAPKAPVQIGQPINVQVMVSSGAGTITPTGTVSLYYNFKTVTAPLIVVNGVNEAVFSIPAQTAPGYLPYSVLYNGDDVYSPTGNVFTPAIAVTFASSSLTLSSNGPLLLPNEPLTLQAQVTTATNPAPTGTITFRDGATVLAVVPISSTQAAAFETQTLGVGVHVISASYSGDTAHLGSTQLAIDVVDVLPPPTLGSAQFTNQSTIVLTFMGPLASVSANNRQNYVVIQPNGKPVPITSASYNATTNKVTLTVAQKLSPGKHYVVAFAGLTGLFGAPVAGQVLNLIVPAPPSVPVHTH